MFGVQQLAIRARGRPDDRRQGRRERRLARRRPDRQPSARGARAVPGRLVRDRPRLVERHLGQRRADLVLAPAAPRRRDPGRPDATDLPRPAERSGRQTEAEDAPPSLTTRERDVLVALCRPLLDRDMFTEPAPRERSPTSSSSPRPPSSSTSRTCTTSSASPPATPTAAPGSPTRRSGAARSR